jgi:hypothetical protein
MLSYQLIESEIQDLQTALTPHLVIAQTKATQCKTLGILSVGLLGFGSYSVNALVQFLNSAESKLQSTTNLFYNLTCSEIAPLNKISYHCEVLSFYNNSALVENCAAICRNLDLESFWVLGAGIGLFLGLSGAFVFCWWQKTKTNFLCPDEASDAFYAPTQATPADILNSLAQRDPELAEETDIFDFSNKLKQQLMLFQPKQEEIKADLNHDVDMTNFREESETLLPKRGRGCFGGGCVIL